MTKKQGRIAALAAVSALTITGFAASTASAATVGPDSNGEAASLVAGDSLTIDLKPASSASSGFHWRVATKPAKKLLRLASNHASSDGKQQVFTYKSLAPGATAVKLQYVGPGRKARAKKTFRLAVLVNEQEPQLDCDASGRHADYSLLARSGQAVVFTLRRSLLVWKGKPVRIGYDAYYGCDLANQRAFRLGSVVDLVNRHQFWNVALRGDVVGFVDENDCSFTGEPNCISIERSVESQDLRTGAVIRSVPVGLSLNGTPNAVPGLVVSPSGGVAWIEQGPGPDGPSVVVRRSDLTAQSGQAVATDSTTLDDQENGSIDPSSLLFDGADAIWTRDGQQQRAPLR